MNKEDIGKFLIGKGYYLTALEFYQELLEDDGTELQSLRDYFNKQIPETNTSDPVRSIKKKSESSANGSLSTYEIESIKSKDDKIALLEYELRKCKEDLYKAKSQLSTKNSSTASNHQTPPPPTINVSSQQSSLNSNGSSNSSPLSSSSNVFLSLSEEDKDTLKELSKERIKSHELKILNYLVKGYLKKNNYTLTAVSMSEEIEDDINHWSDISKTSAEPPSILTMYRYFFENGDSGIAGALSKSMTEIAKLKKDLLETETSFRESKQKVQLLQKENNELLNKNKEFEKKIEEFSRRGLLSPLRSSSAGTSQNDLSGLMPPPPKFGESNNTTITSTSSTATSANKLFDTSQLSVMRKTYRNLVEKRRQTVAFRIISNMDDESEISVRIAEEVDKIRTLDSDNQSIVKIVADSLPNIVPGVLINKREELIPLILIVISNHPDETVRFSLTKLLFNLIKKPNEVQRHVIMRGCMALASFIGPQRTETEILAQCWEQLSEKHPERRVLVADSCGCLSQFASADLRLSLILSILQQLGEDKSTLVKVSVAKNFALLINFFDTADKYNQIEESFKKLLYDSEVEVSIAARLHFLPSLANWSDLLESLHSKLITFLLNEMQSILNKYYSQKDEYKIPEQDVVKLDHLLNCFIDLVPRIHQSIISSSPFISEKDSIQIENEYNKQEALYQFQINNNNNNSSNINKSNNTTTTSTTTTNNNNNNNINNNNNNNNNIKDEGSSSNNNNNNNNNNNQSTITNSAIRISILGPNEMIKLTSQFENYLVSQVSSEIKGWSSLEWISNEFISKFIKIISCIPINNSLVITSFSKALNLFCKTFGSIFTKRIVKNAFNREFQKDPRTDNTKKYRLLSIYTTGALQTLESSELTTFLKDIIVQISMEERGWAHNDIPSLVKCIELLCGNVFDKKKEVGDSLSDLTANPSNQVRSCILNLLKVIIPFFKPDQIANSVIPSLITMSTDPDRTVRFVCLGTLATAASHLNDDSVIERVALSIDRILDDKNHMVEIEFVNSMTKIIPTVKARFRDSFIVPRIIELARKNNLNPSNQQRKEMSQSLFDSIRAYVSCSNVPKELIQEQILPMLKLLLNDALLHDQTFKSMVQNLVNDLEQLIKEDFKNSIGKRGSSNNNNNNNNNNNSQSSIQYQNQNNGSSNSLLNKIENSNLNLPKWSWKK